MMSSRHRPGSRGGSRAESCPGCHARGILHAGVCRGCYDFGRRHRAAACACCRRTLPLKNGYCRCCWLQAALQAAATAGTARRAPDLGPGDFAAITCHQLFFAGMAKMSRRPRPVPPPAGSLPPREPPAAAWQQQELPVPGQSRRFHARHWTAAAITSLALEQARRIAGQLAGTRGWNSRIRAGTSRALTVMLAAHIPGEKIARSSLIPALRPRDLSVTRTAEILDLAGLLHDDRVPSFAALKERRLALLPAGIAAGVDEWLSVLQHGGPRNIDTARQRLNRACPLLLTWAQNAGHLREITAAQVTEAIAPLQGSLRRKTIEALRSLFRHARKTGRIFRDPTAGIKTSRRGNDVIIPLAAGEISRSVAAALTPASRLALALAAAHAARPRAIRHLLPGDIDLAARRLTIAGHQRLLDDLTYQVLTEWLDHRRARWPATANPHVIINKQTGLTTRPVSENAIGAPFRGLTATLEALRAGRQLDEALTHGPDPLYLAVMSGLDETTAIRYANAARHLLTATAEQHDPASPGEPKDRNHP